MAPAPSEVKMPDTKAQASQHFEGIHSGPIYDLTLTDHQIEHLGMDLALAVISLKRMTKQNVFGKFKTHDLINSLKIDQSHVQARPCTFKTSLSTTLAQPGALSKEITTMHSTFNPSFRDPTPDTVEDKLCLPHFLYNHYKDLMFDQKDVSLILRAYIKFITCTKLLSSNNHIKVEDAAAKVAYDKQDPVAYTWFLHHYFNDSETRVPRALEAYGMTKHLVGDEPIHLRPISQCILDMFSRYTVRTISLSSSFNLERLLRLTLLKFVKSQIVWTLPNFKLSDYQVAENASAWNIDIDFDDLSILKQLMNECLMALFNDPALTRAYSQTG